MNSGVKQIGKYALIILVSIIVLGLAIKSCQSKETCDFATGQECHYESTCNPLLIDLILSRLL